MLQVLECGLPMCRSRLFVFQFTLLGRRGSLMLFLFSAQNEVFESYSSAPAGPWKREKAPQLISLGLRIHVLPGTAWDPGFSEGNSGDISAEELMPSSIMKSTLNMILKCDNTWRFMG